MSEAMTNREIEDVLSSIRRLVAQESRPQAPADQSPAPPQPGPAAFQHRPAFPHPPARQPAERLVLTAAQRVTEPDAAASTAPQDRPEAQDLPAPQPEPSIQDRPGMARSELEATISELESALAFPSVLTPLHEQARSAVVAQTEPEAAAGDAAAGAGLDASARAYSAEVPATQEPAAASPPAEVSAPPPSEDDHALIDEDELAEMISRLVRAELRGQLGEKITLQVRKLVRAEVTKLLDERKLLG